MNQRGSSCKMLAAAKSSMLNIEFYFLLVYTGSSISVLHTLTGQYNTNNICMEKEEVDILSVYPDISFGNKKSENITEISFDNRNNRNYKNNRNIL